MKLKPYPEYKGSGLPWLAKLPTRWEIRRAKFIFDEIDIRSTGGEEELLTVSAHDGVIPRSQKTVTMFKAESYEGYKLCWPGDLVINSLWAWMQGLGFSRYHGIVSSAYGVYRPKKTYTYLADYFHYLLRSNAYLWELRVRSKGIWLSRLQLTDPAFMDMPLLLPPREEAQTVVRYLNYKNRQISRFISNKRRLIELLEEQKQAIINRAITRGLNPDVRLKPSGVDWLGDVPEHWEFLKLKWLARVNPSRSESQQLRDSDEPVVFLPMERISTEGDIDTSEQRPVRQLWQGFTYFRRGDVILAKITPCFENGKGACLDELPTEIGFGTTELIVLRAGNRALSQFLYRLTCLTAFRTLGVESMTGAAGQQRVPPDFVANFPVPVPPVQEQQQILDNIRKEITQLAAAISHTQRQIDLLREYRTRLIADVVTGKVDVRGIPVETVPENEALEEFLESEEIEESLDIEEVQDADY